MQNRHALITGAGAGIGAAIAMALARAGCRLTLCGRSSDKLQSQAETLRAQVPELAVLISPMDVTDEKSVQAAVQQAQARLGPVNVLVNNAGQAQSQPFGKTDAALWQHMLNVNLTGSYHCIQAVLPGMLEAAQTGTPGRIVNIASTAGLKGYAYVSAYVAAKHGVVGLTKALALELARKGVTVNAICPGYTETDIVREAVQNIVRKTGKSEAEARQALAVSNPQQRLVQAHEVAQSVLWLCAQGSDAINGQAIAIDGGEMAA
ncbi:SDR family NAD(P)-dependent oxidoreductase [Limnohabitans sp. Rim47]|jgi:NAD(P)-dependent dehydrogenase (short-subunit alcohol dehydrogenase family)|uniref:SDR family NAD(P)-dependent oxidoreductase n=1 Tax=Limnohabitans sp. Rim47 TaxID=1100721 RepID=UPI00031D6216|nr:SDR family NAD(P)-dependent oxidoreductase [Limnohabitans sp. Rim47]